MCIRDSHGASPRRGSERCGAPPAPARPGPSGERGPPQGRRLVAGQVDRAGRDGGRGHETNPGTEGIMSVTLNRTADLAKSIEEARDFLAPKIGRAPEVGIILGTGLGTFAAAMKSAVTIPYREIPGFPVTAVETHAGDLVAGSLAGQPTVLLNGRAHYYEGHAMRDVVFPV